MKRGTPQVDISLLTWNGADFLPRLLSSLAAQENCSFYVWVGDSGSIDDSAHLVEAWLKEHPGELDSFSENRGFSPGHNILMQKGKAPYLLVLNQDVELPALYIARLVHYLDAHPDVASCSGIFKRLVKEKNTYVHSEELDAAGLRLLRSHRVVDRLSGHHVDEAGSGARSVFGVPAVAALYRRSALEAVVVRRGEEAQYFDGAFFAYKEDVELAYRLQLAGYHSVILNDNVAYHARGVASQRDERKAFGGVTTVRARADKSFFARRLSYRNHLYFLLGTAQRLDMKGAFATFFYELTKGVVLLLSEPRVFFFGWRHVAREWRRLRRKRSQLIVLPEGLQSIRNWSNNTDS